MLDTFVPESINPAWTTAVRGMQVEPVHRLLRSQQHAQLQLCVPPMLTEGTSLRLAEATAGKGVIPLT